jgi:hypothetical protein
MSRRVDIRGKSGQSYAFTRLDGETFLRQIGVTFVIAAPAQSGWRVLHVGETNDLADGSWQPKLTAEREREPEAECLIRLNVSRSIREAELLDIEVDPSAN